MHAQQTIIPFPPSLLLLLLILSAILIICWPLLLLTHLSTDTSISIPEQLIINMSEYDAATHGDVDVIFAGGGTAACVAAGRLAKNNPDLKILLVEGGENSFENPLVRNPALFLSHLKPDSKTAIVSRCLVMHCLAAVLIAYIFCLLL